MIENDTRELQSDDSDERPPGGAEGEGTWTLLKDGVRVEPASEIDLYDITVTLTEYDLQAIGHADDPEAFIEQAIRSRYVTCNTDEIPPVSLRELRERLADESHP